jgi:dienelactone hydrolase
VALVSRTIEYTVEGTLLEGYFVWDDSWDGPRPAVAVAHTWAGRGEFECGKARKLAEQGYVGFALDMYGKGILGTGPEENAALMNPLLEDRALLQKRINGAIECLREQPQVNAAQVAAMGFCFGGLCALDLARSGSDVCGVVSFHGLFAPAANLPKPQIQTKVLCLHGYDDPMAKPDSMVALADEMNAAGADWQVHAYGGTVHAFTNPVAADPDNGLAYSEKADRRSWQALINFLEEVFSV